MNALNTKVHLLNFSIKFAKVNSKKLINLKKFNKSISTNSPNNYKNWNHNISNNCKKLNSSLNINLKNNLGEFHQNQFWTLEVLLSKKPISNLIETKLNSLARQLNISEYYINDINLQNKNENILKTILIT